MRERAGNFCKYAISKVGMVRERVIVSRREIYTRGNLVGYSRRIASIKVESIS